MGNCLDRNTSDENDDETIDENESSSSNQTSGGQQAANHHQHLHHHHHHHHRHRHHSSGYSRRGDTNYSRLSESSSSLSSVNSASRRDSNNNSNHANFLNSLANLNPTSSSGGSPLDTTGTTTAQQQQVFYLAPNVQRTAEQLTEEEQIKLLKRMTLIQQLPTGQYDGTSKKAKECVICMIDFELNDTIKYLPCMHTFHQSCIDNWLVRSLVCPSCIEPVDALILEHMIMSNQSN